MKKLTIICTFQDGQDETGEKVIQTQTAIEGYIRPEVLADVILMATRVGKEKYGALFDTVLDQVRRDRESRDD